MPSLAVRLVAAILAVLGPLMTEASLAAEKLRSISGSPVYGVAPAGFVEDENFPGLLNREIRASIVVLEIPNDATLVALFSSKAALNTKFRRTGVRFEDIETLTTNDGLIVRIARGRHSAETGQFERWVGLIADEEAAMVTLQVNDGNKIPTEAVRAFYRSLTFGAPRSLSEKLQSLPFTLDVVAPFQVAANMGGAGVLLTSGPDPSKWRYGQSFILVLRDHGIAPQANLEKYAEAALRGTSTFQTAEIKSVRRVLFAGRQGVEFEGISIANGYKRVFKQRFVRGVDGPLRMIACGPRDKLNGLDDEIERISASIAFRPKRQ